MRKPLSPEAIASLNDVMRRAVERMERRAQTVSKSDRALELFEKGIDTQTICTRLSISMKSIHTMLRCARDKRARWMGQLADEMGHNV